MSRVATRRITGRPWGQVVGEEVFSGRSINQRILSGESGMLTARPFGERALAVGTGHVCTQADISSVQLRRLASRVKGLPSLRLYRHHRNVICGGMTFRKETNIVQ